MNKNIAITGGKGGTGKSTVAVALAHNLAKNNKVLLVDADVDCPSDNLLLSLKLKKIEDVETMVPIFDFKKCIKCGQCGQVCPEQAIVSVKNKNPLFIPDRCIGCKACKISCPVGAISEGKQKMGEILIGKKGNLTLISGKMKTGIEESSLIVNAVKKLVDKKERKYDYIVTDTAAGTHCPVITALIGNDFAFAVAEPTSLGNHDLDLILSLTEKLKVKSNIVLNRSDINSDNLIKKTGEKYNSKIIARIPYSKKIEQLYSKGKPIEHASIQKIAKEIKK